MESELAAGSVIEGRYRLERPLAEGGMGVVWAAARVDGGPPVALKLLRSASSTTPAMYRRFLREARAAAAVRHPSVVTVHEVLALEDGSPVIVMDLLKGEPLRARLDRERLLPLPDLARILLPVISAVGSAHALGIVHRDLKPENIFILEAGQGLAGSARIKVLDFGIAKLTAIEGDAAKTAGLTDSGTILGTPYYMAPEQVTGAIDVDFRADIWSLGVILYESLTGVRPTEGASVGKILKRVLTGAITPVRLVAPNIPRNVVDLIDRMLTVDRDQRPSLQEVGKMLARYGNVTFRPFGPPVSYPPPPPSEPLVVPVHDTGAETLSRPDHDLEVAATLSAPAQDVSPHPGLRADEPRYAPDPELAPTLSSAPPPAPEDGAAAGGGPDDRRLFEAAVTPQPGKEAAPAERGSEPPAPPATTWVTVVVCTLVIALGSALILIWQRP